MTVVDTSGIVDFLLGTGVAAEVEAMLGREEALAAPELLVFETLAVLRRDAERGVVSAARAAGAVSVLGTIPLVLFATLELRERAWALQDNFTIADAIFIALAEHLGTALATKDLPLATEAVKHTEVAVLFLSTERS
ncbi:MAG: type II toxin-antitoxin system VapC family toxin [Solirubrobacteraceae bacterium]